MHERNIFKIAFELAREQPWIAKKYDALEVLLFSDCRAEEHRDLVTNLIKRFIYLSNDKYMELIKELAEEIATDPTLNEKNTQIVASAAGSNSDSSQHVLYTLKPIFEELKWREHQVANTFTSAYRNYKKNSDYNQLILIDEFIGTGETMIGRIKEMSRTFDQAGVSDYEIKVKVLVATEIGVENLNTEGIDVSSRITLSKGISDYYSPETRSKKIDLMLNLEGLLKERFKDRELPTLGYGKTESLYCREDGNTPNSVFPVFWWPIYRDGGERITILTRAMGDA